MVGDPGGGTLKNQAGLAMLAWWGWTCIDLLGLEWWGYGYGYGLHGIFTGEFCDEGTKGLSNWKAIEGRVGSL